MTETGVECAKNFKSLTHKKVHNINARHSSTDLILSEVRLEVGKRGFYYQEAHMCSLPSVYFKISLSVKEHIVAIFTNFNQIFI